MDQKHHPVRLMVEDACIVLAPTVVMFIVILWIYRKEWDAVWLAHFLMSFLPFSQRSLIVVLTMSLWRDSQKYSAGIKVAFFITVAQIAITFATVLLLVFR